MKKASMILIGLLLSVSTSISAKLLPSTAITTAERFVVMLDNNHDRQAYEQTSALLQLQTQADTWIHEQRMTSKMLGNILNRRLFTVKARETYPGLPDGNYLIVAFEAETQHKAKAIEVLLLKEESSDWQVCKYSIR